MHAPAAARPLGWGPEFGVGQAGAAAAAAEDVGRARWVMLTNGRAGPELETGGPKVGRAFGAGCAALVHSRPFVGAGGGDATAAAAAAASDAAAPVGHELEARAVATSRRPATAAAGGADDAAAPTTADGLEAEKEALVAAAVGEEEAAAAVAEGSARGQAGAFGTAAQVAAGWPPSSGCAAAAGLESACVGSFSILLADFETKPEQCAHLDPSLWPKFREPSGMASG